MSDVTDYITAYIREEVYYKSNFMIKGKDYIGVGCGAMIFNDEGKVFLAK